MKVKEQMIREQNAEMEIAMKELEYAQDMDKLDELIQGYGIEYIRSILDEWKPKLHKNQGRMSYD